MAYRSRYPHDIEEIKKRAPEMSDGELINQVSLWVHSIHSLEHVDWELKDWEKQGIEEAKKRIAAYQEELDKRHMTYSTYTYGKNKERLGTQWYKDHMGIVQCEICRTEVSNRSGFCDKCEAELQELTNAWNAASDEVKEYFRDRIEEELDD